MASDWWQQKAQQLTGTNEPPRHGITVPRQQPVQQQPVAPQPVQQQQPTAPQQQVVQQPGNQQVLDPNRPPDAEIGMGDALRLWQGGPAAKTEGNLSCPECGSRTGYTEYSRTQMHGGRPRPHCFECGYNGLFSQGLESSWA